MVGFIPAIFKDKKVFALVWNEMHWVKSYGLQNKIQGNAKMKVVRLNEKFVNEFWRLRLQLFEELGEVNSHTNIFELEAATKEYYTSHINKDLISWGIFDKDAVVASGALCLFERIPYHENVTGKEGYILNVYTRPDYRKNGYAGLLVNEMIKYASQNGIRRLWLTSSEKGKRLYMQAGFVERDNEMELFL